MSDRQFVGLTDRQFLRLVDGKFFFQIARDSFLVKNIQLVTLTDRSFVRLTDKQFVSLLDRLIDSCYIDR